ncbi:MAG TPA: DUF448 domain-containing protein [Streptosporangiaceae bacterium]
MTVPGRSQAAAQRRQLRAAPPPPGSRPSRPAVRQPPAASRPRARQPLAATGRRRAALLPRRPARQRGPAARTPQATPGSQGRCPARCARPRPASPTPCPVPPTRRPCKLDEAVVSGLPHSLRQAAVVRTCVGCGVRAAKSDLLRLVAVGDVIVADAAARMPGRGAYLHPSQGCLDRARRRRAFPRALRLQGPLRDDELDGFTWQPPPGGQPAAAAGEAARDR